MADDRTRIINLPEAASLEDSMNFIEDSADGSGTRRVTYGSLKEAVTQEVAEKISYEENNGFLRKNLFNIFGNINTKRDGSTESNADLKQVRNGEKIIVNASGARSYGAGQAITGISGKMRFAFTVESLGNGTSLVARIYNTANYSTPLATISATSAGEYTYDITMESSITYAFVWYVAAGTAPCGGIISNVGLYDPSVLSNIELLDKIKKPSLSEEMKAAVVGLANAYYDNREMFSYYATTTRNEYVDNEASFGPSGRAVLNCSSFIQMVLMGRNYTDFESKENYSPAISKVFNNGFYFNFPMRTQAYGLAIKENDEVTGYYGFVHKGGDTYEGSYSYNSHYSSGSQNLYKQTFNEFMYAPDMANELYNLGCEIDFGDLEIGDLVFFSSIDNKDGSFADTAFRNIIHVAMVENVYFRNGNKVVYMIECTGTYGGYPRAIVKWSLFSSSDTDKAKASFYLQHVAMCARNPIAFGFAGHAVPSAIAAI